MQWIETTTRPEKDKTRKEETEEGERERNRERERGRERGESELHNKRAIQRFDLIPHNTGPTSAHSPTHFTESNSTLDPMSHLRVFRMWWGGTIKEQTSWWVRSLYIIVHRKDTFIQINSPCQVPQARSSTTSVPIHQRSKIHLEFRDRFRGYEDSMITFELFAKGSYRSVTSQTLI